MQENKSNSIFLISSVILGVLAIIVSFVYLDRAGGTDQVGKIKIMVAARDLREGSVVNAKTDLQEFEAPASLSGAKSRYLTPEVARAYDHQRVNRYIPAGTPIMTADFAAASTLDLSGPDSRAIAIQVKGAEGLTGILIPGDYVKLLVTRPVVRSRVASTQPSPNANAGPAWETATLLPDPVKVLAVGQWLSRSRQQISVADQYRSASQSQMQSITLEVTEKQASIILQDTGAGVLPVSLLLCPSPAKSAGAYGQ